MENIKTVYITSKGKKYHNKYCRSIQGYKIIPISLKEAESKHKLPCKLCNLSNNNCKNIKKKVKNVKKIKNCINRDDVDDTIFNDSTSLMENKNNEINKNNITHNLKKEEKNNNNKYKIEEIDSNSSDSDDSNYSNEIQINNFTESLSSNFNSLKKESSNESKETIIKQINIISNTKNEEINNIPNEKKISVIKTNNILSNIENINNYIKDKKMLNEEHKIINGKIHNNIHDIEESKCNEDNEDEIKYKNCKNLDKDYSNNFNMKNNPNNSIKNQFIDNIIQEFKLNKNNSPYNFNNMYNNYKANYICEKYDMNILEETYYRATILSLPFDQQKLLNDLKYINYNPNAIKGQMKNDSYMFKFEISSLLPNNNIFLKIKVGFKLEYINMKDINILLDENSINEENMNYNMGSLGSILKLQRHLEIFKNTGIVYALINISKGKFFIIGKKELEKRKKNIFLDRSNTEIFYVQNFLSISPNILKNIRPSFHMDKKYLKFFEIKFNDKK